MIYTDGSDSYLPGVGEDPEEVIHWDISLAGPPPVRTLEEQARVDAAIEAGRRRAEMWMKDIQQGGER